MRRVVLALSFLTVFSSSLVSACQTDMTAFENECVNSTGGGYTFSVSCNRWGTIRTEYGCRAGQYQDSSYDDPSFLCTLTGDKTVESFKSCPSGPPPEAPNTEPILNNPSTSCGSIIRTSNQTVSEIIPISGVEFPIVYSSEKVKGYKSSNLINIPITKSIPQFGSLLSIELSINLNGQNLYQETYAPSSNILDSYLWDGKDANGNDVAGPQRINVNVTQIYPDQNPQLDPQPIGTWSRLSDIAGNSSRRFRYTPPYAVTLGTVFGNDHGFGGWDFSVHHKYDHLRRTLFKGDGTSYTSGHNIINGTYHVAAEDRSEVYIFDSSLKHIQTKDPMTGIIKYTFQYIDGKLVGIKDKYNKETTVQYNNGRPVSITSPYGVVTSIQTDTNGYISSVTDPLNKSYTMEYSSTGLLLTFETPVGNEATFVYNSEGRLLSDLNSEGSEITLSNSRTDTSYIVNESTALGRNSIHTTTLGNATERVDTLPNGMTKTTVEGPTGEFLSIANSNNFYYSSVKAYDSRFYANVRPSETSINAGNKSYYASHAETVTLSNPQDPYSLTNFVSSSTVNGKVYQQSFNQSTKTWTSISPVGRTYVTQLNSLGDVSSIQYASFTPVDVVYDSNGRMTEISQGANRKTEFNYNSSNGLVATVKNALNQITTFTYDLAGRVLSQTFPDNRTINFSYDGDGNLTGITPPGKTQHHLEYNGYGYLKGYEPPALLSIINPKTTYTYSNDRELLNITRPDGQEIDFSYGTANGNLNSILLPNGNRNFTYSAGVLTQSSSEDVINKTYNISGGLITAENTSDGVINFGVYNVYTTNFSYASERLITGIHNWLINFGYDDDNLLVSAGDQTLTRSPATGALTQTDLGNVSQFFDYSTTFGELSSIEAVYDGTDIYSETMTRDNLGRISTMTEKYGSGSPKTYSYLYDVSGRLTEVKLNGSTISSYGYNSNSNRTSQTVNGTSLYPNSNPLNFNLGNVHSCVITAGGVKCWGYGQYLGYGNTTNIGDNEAITTVGYVNVGGTATELASGHSHTCAVLTDKKVRCWGANTYGQLGLSHTNHIGNDELPDSEATLNLGGDVKKIVSGALHTCALKTDNNVICWGLGTQGRLGYGNTNNIGDDEHPSAAGNVDTGVTSEIIQIVAGKEHTCILTATGNVKCWGRNAYFQLGQGSLPNSIGDNELPSSVGFINFGETVTQISSSGDHTCALFQNQKIKCWGRNDSGQLGLATTTTLTTPVSTHPYVNVGADVKFVTAGKNSTCVITVNDEAKCWGENSVGQLGQGHTNTLGDDEDPSTIPPISLGGPVIAIDASGNHTCAIRNTGEMLCWGVATYGILGYGNGNTIGDDELPSSVGVIPSINLGNIIYDEQDRLVQFGSKSYSYNKNGDLTSVTDFSNSTTKNFEYDVFGNLKEVTLPSKTINYLVDAHNRRVIKKENDNIVAYYIWNTRNQLIGIADGTGELQARFIYGSKSHVPDYMSKNNINYQIVTNHLGSPVSIVNASSGAVAQEIVWDEWGNVVSDSNPGFMPFGYAGCLYDLDTKLCRFGARDYDASIGRWLSKDPILFAGGDTNLYGYVMQDPVNLIDPSGLCPWCIAAGIGAAISGGIDLGTQLAQNGGNFGAVNWGSVGTSALIGAGLSALGPTGALLGRGGSRAAQFGYNQAPGLLNRGAMRFGWSGPKNGLDVLSFRNGAKHFDLPWLGLKSGANAIRDGFLSGLLGGSTSGGSCGE